MATSRSDDCAGMVTVGLGVERVVGGVAIENVVDILLATVVGDVYSRQCRRLLDALLGCCTMGAGFALILTMLI